MITLHNNVPNSQTFTPEPVGFFPGLGSRSAFRTLECDLSLSDAPDIRDAYTQGAAALGLEAKQIVLTPANLPEDRIERQAFLGAALLVHGIVLQRHLDSEAARAGTQIRFAAFTGESFGIITAAVAAGALSIADGTKLAYALAPFILVGAEGAQGLSPLQARIASVLAQSGVMQPLVAEPAHVVGLSGRPDALQKALATLKDTYSAQDVELHKVYAEHQVNLYVRMGIRESFGLFMANFPELSLQELKEPTAFMAHAARMAPVREAFACMMDEEGINFHDAHTPLICNHKAAIVQGAADIREAVLAVIDRVMQSRWTAKGCEHVGANLVLELGQGDKSIRLLNDNGLTLPAMGYTGALHSTEALVEAARLLQAFGETARSNIQSTDLTPDALALLRQMFQVPARYPEIAKFLRREFAKTIAANQIDRRHPLAPMSRRFIEVYQHSIAAAGDLDLDAGELALQVQAKKTVVGDSHTLGRVNTEIKVLRADGTIVHRISNARWSSEALVFYCSRLEDRPAVELIHAGRRMSEHTPEIATLYRASSAFLPFDLTDTLQMPSGMLQPRAIAALQILHQLSMLTLLRRERPAIFTSHDYYAAGDLLGWCVALAATGALSARDAVALYATHLETHLEKMDVADPVDTILDRLRESTAPIVAASGVPLITIKDIARETRALFSHAVFDARRHILRLNGDVQIVCLASSPAHETFDTTPFSSEVTLIATPADITRRGHNTALEALEHCCMSLLTGDNQRVLQFAQGRKILSSTVFSYIKLGEQVLGFGKGGSESMTVFVTRQTIMPLDTSKPIIVRKVLSEALIEVGWNPDGEGVMLPPFRKAKRQAEFLKALPDPARWYFPEVFEILEREIPVPPHQRQGMQRDSFKETIYEMSFVPGEEVSRYVERCSPPPAIVARIYEQIALVLARDVHSLYRAPAPGQTLETSYFHKIEARLALCRRTAPLTFGPNLLDTDHIVINGVQYRNVGTLLKAFREHPAYCEILEPRVHALVMGDTNTENIKINNLGPLQHAQILIESGAAQSEIDAALDAMTASSIDLRFLDPRAIGFASEGAETRDDPMYDNKPWHNSLGHYDEMHHERFELAVRTGPSQTPDIQITYEPNNPYARAYCVEDLTERGIDIASQPGGVGMEHYFAPVMRKLYDMDNPNSPRIAEDPHWLVRFVFMMGTHFMAMPPFHFQTEFGGALIDSLLVQRRPVAIFCEGIRWLNWALQMLEGTRHSFLGIEVPAASVPHQPHYGTGLPNQASRQMAISPNPAFSRIGMAAMAPESRVICTPWSRMVRGLALGQYPVGYDDAIAGIITQARDILTQQVTKPTGYLRFALQLAELGIALNRPGVRVTHDELQTRATGLMDALCAETNPYYAAVGGGILFDAFAKFRLDISLLNSTRDFAAEMLDVIDRIQPDQIKDENAGNHGEYEKLFAYTSIFLGFGQAGLTNRLTSGPRNYVREALHLIQTVPSPFFKGRGCSMLFSVLSAIGLDGMIFDDGHDFMKEVLEYVDRDDSIDFPLRFPQPITRAYEKIYPRITMLNAIAISGRHEYASMGHDRVAELKPLWAELEPAEKMHQSLYYLIALHNLGRTEQEIGSVHVLMDELLGYLDVVDPGANFFLNGLSHAYVVESAMLTGRLGDIPPQEIDRIAGCLKRMDATPIDRASRAYPFSYNLNALGEIGEAGALMSPNPVYGGISAFSWLVGQFSPDGQTEGSRLLMLGNALMGLGLRLRPREQSSTPMFDDIARRRGWKIEA
ncbi:hypothetical protein F5Y16DRAFT_392631 [Xylariaceae sp. FL0255]|nr:hypothetical protein F5Y16DRAFT_392631 [Xylariaceae sp. FL0255]